MKIIFFLSLGSPQLGKCHHGVTAPERLGTADLEDAQSLDVMLEEAKNKTNDRKA